jgi:hypothetical protein
MTLSATQRIILENAVRNALLKTIPLSVEPWHISRAARTVVESIEPKLDALLPVTNESLSTLIKGGKL